MSIFPRHGFRMELAPLSSLRRFSLKTRLPNGPIRRAVHSWNPRIRARKTLQKSWKTYKGRQLWWLVLRLHFQPWDPSSPSLLLHQHTHCVIGMERVHTWACCEYTLEKKKSMNELLLIYPILAEEEKSRDGHNQPLSLLRSPWPQGPNMREDRDSGLSIPVRVLQRQNQ